MRYEDQKVQILTSEDELKESVVRIEHAARVCYKSEDKMTSSSTEPFLKSIISRGHESVLEHGSCSVLIVTNRGIANELTRHRLASFSQESTRYCAYDKDKFGSEISIVCDNNGWKQVMDMAFEKSEEIYMDLRKIGCPPEIARDVLPLGLKTELVMTANFREWRHVLKLRTSKASHPMIRSLCFDILRNFRNTIPIIFDDIQMEDHNAVV